MKCANCGKEKRQHQNILGVDFCKLTEKIDPKKCLATPRNVIIDKYTFKEAKK